MIVGPVRTRADLIAEAQANGHSMSAWQRLSTGQIPIPKAGTVLVSGPLREQCP